MGEDKRPVTCAEAGQRGGRRTVERHGVEHFQRIGAEGGRRTRQLVEAAKEAERQEDEDQRAEQG